MNMFDLKDATQQSLCLLKQSGASAKTVKSYLNTGFGAVNRYFAKKGIFKITNEQLDAYVLVQREQFEGRAFSEWKWRLIRRGSELLKYFVRTGTIDLPELKPWEPTLRKPRQSVEMDTPTPEQLADNDDIFALTWRVKQALLHGGLTKATVRHYTTEGMSIILRRHISQGLTQYSESMVSDIVAKKRCSYEQGLTSRVSYQNLRKASFLLSEMHCTGVITFSKITNWGQREPSAEFAVSLRHFCNYAKQTEMLTDSTICTVKSTIRTFLFELETQGKQTFESTHLLDISNAVTHMAKRYTGGLRAAIFSVRVFLRHLYENHFTSENLSLAIPEMVARRTTFREGFTPEETMRLLNEPNQETDLGKRNYAMMLLAAQTGLRACDVVNLKRENIDWRAQEIRIIQRKTGKPLCLPLNAESGNAIANYLLHARPKSDLPYIFLCHVGILRPVNNRSASDIVTKSLRHAGITSTTPRRGFHSFRRAFGTRLLQNEIPLELLQQLLGHSQMDSAKPYLSADEQGLQACALGLVSSENVGELV
ncbi:MAG: site-specific integrase [Ruthenibacterium sp.]